MTSGILQLVYESQYSNLFNINPQISYFRIIYYRYSMFCKESIIEQFDDTPDWNKEVSLTLSKVGDLVHRMYLVCNITLDQQPLTILQLDNLIGSIDITIDPLKTLIENRLNEVSTLSFNLVQDIIAQLGITDILDKIRSGTLTNYSNEELAVSELDGKIKVNLDESYYEFKPVHLENIAENTANIITISELLELYSQNDIYRVYLLIDYVYYINLLSSFYSKNSFSRTDYRSTMNTILSHPILSFLNKKLQINFLKYFAHFIIKNIVLEIGGNKIAEYDSHFFNCFMQLNNKLDNPIYENMITPNGNNNFNLYIPLVMWFNLHNTLAIPCIALRYHEIVFKVTFTDLNNLVTVVPTLDIPNYTVVHLTNAYFMTEYVSVEHPEKVKFTTRPLEYLIVQTQKINTYSTTKQDTISMDIDFFHPCLELIWVVVVSDKDGNFDSEYFIPNTKIKPIIKSQIIINNEVISNDNTTMYYSVVQPHARHSRTPNNGINVYSFSLDPELYQPTGSLNIGEIPHKSIQVTLDPYLLNKDYTLELIVYAVNYNILRIANGFSRLFYE